MGSFIFRGPAVAAFCPKKGAGAASLFSGKAGVTSDNLSVPTDFAAQSRLRPALCLACMENVVSELEPRVSVWIELASAGANARQQLAGPPNP